MILYSICSLYIWIMKSEIIISESNRPIWQIPVAALLFTVATALTIKLFYEAQLTNEHVRSMISGFESVVFLIVIGISFCSRKRIYIDIKKSRFKPTIEVGFIKIGKWKTIINYEYVSVFHQPLSDGGSVFEVNLWYDKNKHFNLYEQYDYKEAFLMGYDLSEELDIDLLDATVPNDFKWIDKDEWKTKLNEASTK